MEYVMKKDSVFFTLKSLSRKTSVNGFLSKLLLSLFGKNNEVHYIGGSEVLPAPLTQEEEAELISMMGINDDKDAEIKNNAVQINESELDMTSDLQFNSEDEF